MQQYVKIFQLSSKSKLKNTDFCPNLEETHINSKTSFQNVYVSKCYTRFQKKNPCADLEMF